MKRATVKAGGSHACEVFRYCSCWLLGDEPNEKCDIHGWSVPRCRCGRFVLPRAARTRKKVK